jgi:hypothetical protein
MQLRALAAFILVSAPLVVPLDAAAQGSAALPSTSLGAGKQPPLSDTTAPAFDIRTIDPEMFQAIALRIPDGLTPQIDGCLDDEVWHRATPAGKFYQREPHYGQPSSEKTEFRILYDDQKIYFGVWLWDSDAARIFASEMRRDSGLSRSSSSRTI